MSVLDLPAILPPSARGYAEQCLKCFVEHVFSLSSSITYSVLWLDAYIVRVVYKYDW